MSAATPIPTATSTRPRRPRLPLFRPDIAEAAKYRNQYGAQHAIMIASAYAAEKKRSTSAARTMSACGP